MEVILNAKAWRKNQTVFGRGWGEKREMRDEVDFVGTKNKKVNWKDSKIKLKEDLEVWVED